MYVNRARKMRDKRSLNCERTPPVRAGVSMSPELIGDKKAVFAATVLSDLGKNGAAFFPPHVRRLIRRMYGVENVPNGHKLTVRDFLFGPYREKYGLTEEQVQRDLSLFEEWAAIWFPEAAQKMEGGAAPRAENVPMLRFWSWGHTLWSTLLVRDDWRVADAMVRLHHILEGVNPLHAIREDGMMFYGRGFSVSTALVAVVDKYETFLSRSGMGRDEALEAVRSTIERAASPGGGLERAGLNEEGRARVAQCYRQALSILEKSLH